MQVLARLPPIWFLCLWMMLTTDSDLWTPHSHTPQDADKSSDELGGGLSWPEPDLRLCPRAENNPKQPPAPPAGVKISKPDTKPRHTEMLLHNVECVCCAAGRPATKPFILIKVVLFDFCSLLAQSVRHVRGDASPAQWQHVLLFQTQPLFVPLFDFIKPFSVFLQQEAPVKIGLIALATRCYVLPALCLCIYLYQ